MSYSKTWRAGLMSATMLAGLAAAAPAAAQVAESQAVADDTAPGSGDPTQESGNEIVVTATRRATTIQDTPINISAIGAAELAAERLDDVRDLGAFTPGITVTDTGPRGAGTIVMRGLSADDTAAGGNNNDDAFGTYLGEVPLYLDFKLIDLQRVETLLGPQGTLYGLGTLAGAIRYIPNRPNPDRVEGYGHARAYDVAHSSGVGYVVDAAINLPIIPGVMAFRSATGYYYDPGFIDYPFIVKTPGVSIPQPGTLDNPAGTQAQRDANFAPQNDLNWERTFTTRNQFGITVPDFNAYLTYVFQETRSNGRQATGGGAFGEGKYEGPWRFAEPSKRYAHLVSLELEAEIGDIFKGVWVSAFTNTRTNAVTDVTDLLLDLDYDYELFPSFAGFTTGITERNQFNQEIRLISTHGGPFNWVVGGFYNKQRVTATGVERLPGFPEFAASPEGSEIYGGFYDGLVRPDGAEYVSFTRSKTEEMAVYGELTFRPIDRWQVTGGLRFYSYDTAITGGTDTPLLPGGRRRMPYPSLEIAPSRVRSGDTSASGMVWKVNTSFDFTDDVLGYATYSTGYRVGGVNRVAPCILPLPPGQNLCALPNELAYDPDETKNIEVGVRAQLFDRRLSLNLAVFNIDWEGIQLASQTVNGAIGITANAGSARSRGVDFSFNARVTPQFTLRGNYSYLDAKLTETAPDLLGTADGFVDAEAGDRLPGSARHSGAASAIYNVPLGENTLRLNWTATYTGDILTRPGARAGGEKLPDYMMHRASVTYDTGLWELSLFANNIFDKYAITGVSNDLTRFRQINDGIIGRYYAQSIAQPRVIGLEGRFTF
ncbi:TonB-dependent receptor [Sphingomonas spermidinifaciens]|uniref:TonB-dependent receptor n=1 Tax=Sphingomonas spermidinifaciens TaxID=1141889 RepID=A0A2A4AYT6_9SPHN|nr:TonB-dependent receptor [Sphingomonas spermidinifaciens]PCD02103.1 TonB-dependent receptor [Sphingomonas spermidinifaciens]